MCSIHPLLLSNSNTQKLPCEKANSLTDAQETPQAFGIRCRN
jgi:hypothetical protein